MKKTMSWSLSLAILWLLFTLALVSWWINVFYSFIHEIHQTQVVDFSQLGRLENMVVWEGISLIVLVCAGAVPLIYLIYKEKKRSIQFKQFFASFTHDLKTAMASLRLQSECLLDDLGERASDSDQRLIRGILKDTGRLQLQLDNSLVLANIKNENLFIEKLSLSELVERLTMRWPQLKIELINDATVMADQQGLESVFNNLCQNSLVHGAAKKLTVEVIPGSTVVIKINDDGTGFSGDLTKLTKPFIRHGRTSGSGLGLYLSHQLMERMLGGFNVQPTDCGFEVLLLLPGESA